MDLAEPILKTFKKKTLPNIEVGDIVRVHQRIREGNKERIQVFEGVVIAKHRKKSLDATFTVRRIASGVGVERIYLVHSPNITKIEFKKSSSVRRSKLYYLRELTGKALKLKDKKKAKDSWEELLVADEKVQTEATEKDIAEAVAADEKKKAEAAKQAEVTTEVPSQDGQKEEPTDEPTSSKSGGKPAGNDKPAESNNGTGDTQGGE